MRLLLWHNVSANGYPALLAHAPGSRRPLISHIMFCQVGGGYGLDRPLHRPRRQGPAGRHQDPDRGAGLRPGDGSGDAGAKAHRHYLAPTRPRRVS
jgi:hypothetical protein